MKKARFTDEQIVRILQEADRDPIAAVAKRHGVGESSIYVWLKRFVSVWGSHLDYRSQEG